MSIAYLLDPSSQKIKPQFLPAIAPEPPIPPTQVPNIFYEFPSNTGNTFADPSSFQPYQQITIQADIAQQLEDLHAPVIGAKGQLIKFGGPPVCIGNIDEGITTTCFNLLAVIVGQSLTFTSTHDSQIFEINQTITITYSTTDNVSGTITAINADQITFTVSAVNTAPYNPSVIYSSNPAVPTQGQTSVSLFPSSSINLPISKPSFSPLSNYIITATSVYVEQNGVNPGTFTVSIADANTGTILSTSDNAIPLQLPVAGLYPPISTATFSKCLIKKNEKVAVNIDSLVQFLWTTIIIGQDFYSVYIGSITGYAVPYSSGVVQITAGAPPVHNSMTLWNDTGNGSILLYDPTIEHWVTNYIVLAGPTATIATASSISSVDDGELPAPFNNRGAFVFGDFTQASFFGRDPAQSQLTVANLGGCFYFDAVLAEAGAVQPIIQIPDWAGFNLPSTSTFVTILTLPQVNIGANEWGDTNFIFAIAGVGFIYFYNLNAGVGSLLSIKGLANFQPEGVIETMSVDYSTGDLFIGGSYIGFINPPTAGEYAVIYQLGAYVLNSNVIPPNSVIDQAGAGGSFEGAVNFIRTSNSDNQGNFYFSGQFKSPSGPGGLIQIFNNTASTPQQMTTNFQYIPSVNFTPTSAGVLDSFQIQTGQNTPQASAQFYLVQIRSSDNSVSINPTTNGTLSGQPILGNPSASAILFPQVGKIIATGGNSFFCTSISFQIYSGQPGSYNVEMFDGITGTTYVFGNVMVFSGNAEYTLNVNQLFTDAQWNNIGIENSAAGSTGVVGIPYVSNAFIPNQFVYITVRGYMVQNPAVTIVSIPYNVFTPIICDISGLGISVNSQTQYTIAVTSLGTTTSFVPSGFLTYSMSGTLYYVGTLLNFYGIISYTGAASYIINSAYVSDDDYGIFNQIPLFGTAAASQICQSVYGYSTSSIWKTGFSSASSLVVGRWTGGSSIPQVLISNSLPYWIIDDQFTAGEAVYLASYSPATGSNQSIAMRYQFSVSPILYVDGGILTANSGILLSKITFGSVNSTVTMMANKKNSWSIISSTGNVSFS